MACDVSPVAMFIHTISKTFPSLLFCELDKESETRKFLKYFLKISKHQQEKNPNLLIFASFWKSSHLLQEIKRENSLCFDLKSYYLQGTGRREQWSGQSKSLKLISRKIVSRLHIMTSCQLGMFCKHLATFGNFWQVLAAFGNFQQLLVSFGIFGQLLSTLVNIWQLLPTFGNFCQFFWGIFWQHLPTFGNLLQLFSCYVIFLSFYLVILSSSPPDFLSIRQHCTL